MELWQQVVLTLITALVSPMFLKWYEFVMNKSSQAERDRQAEAKETKKNIEALGLRIDELRDKNTSLTTTTALQQQTINELKTQAASDKQTITEQARQIVELRKEVGQRDEKILELETRVNILSRKRGAK